MKNRRILLHDRTGVSFTIQLARELARRGHEVLYSYGAFFQSPKGRLARNERDPANLQIVGMQLTRAFQKYSLLRRRFQEIEYANQLVIQIKDYHPDVVIITGSHPDALRVVFRECKKLPMKIVFWMQDIYGVAIKRILNRRIHFLGSLVGLYYIWQERRILEQSDEIILITEDFVELTDQWQISRDKLHVVHNWAPLSELPMRPKNNPWAQAHELHNKFCILYSGTLGLKHNPNLLLQLALHHQANEQVRVVCISEGLGADWLAGEKERLGLANLILLPFQPFVQMPDVLGTADILVAILEEDASVYSAPSKVLTYLCAERALLLAVPPENLSARIVSDNDAGLVVPPTEDTALVRESERLMEDEQLRQHLARNARKFAETHFDLRKIGDRFEAIIGS